MSRGKKNQKEEVVSVAGNPGAEERLMFEREEAKLKRRRMKCELEMWQAEIDLLKLFAEYAADAKRGEYQKRIAELEGAVQELKGEFKLIKKLRQYEPEILMTTFDRTLEETTGVFADTEKLIEEARPHMEPVPA